jgi:hypothetical protein
LVEAPIDALSNLCFKQKDTFGNALRNSNNKKQISMHIKAARRFSDSAELSILYLQAPSRKYLEN